MVLLNFGEASSAGQTMQQAQAELLELITLLLKKLPSFLNSNSEEIPTPEQQQQIDSLSAQSIKALVGSKGVQEMTEDGLAQVYRTEGYILSTNLNDSTGYPVYTVTGAERGEVLKFQDAPNRQGEYVFYDTQHSLDDRAKADLLRSLQSSLEGKVQQATQSQTIVADALSHEPDVSATPDMRAFDDYTDRAALSGKQISDAAAAKVRTDLETLGDFAPSGSKAALVAHQVLGHLSEREGERYSVHRTESGSIELFAGRLPNPSDPEPNPPLVSLAPDGNVSCSPAFTPAHSKAFSSMSNRLNGQSNKHSSKALTVTKPKATVIEGR